MKIDLSRPYEEYDVHCPVCGVAPVLLCWTTAGYRVACCYCCGDIHFERFEFLIRRNITKADPSP